MYLASIRNIFQKRGDKKRAGIIHNKFLSIEDLETASDRPRLKLNNDDNPFFHNLVIESKPRTELKLAHASNKLLLSAMAQLEEFVEDTAHDAGREWVSRLNGWVEFLSKRLKVIVVEVPTEVDAFLIFETLNDRGADLTIADLPKNHLFGRSKSSLEAVRDGWLAALSALNMSAENNLFTTFLRHFWSSKNGSTRERYLFKSVKEQVVTERQAVEFSQELRENARVYAALLNSEHEFWSNFGTTARNNVNAFLRLDLEQIRPLLLSVMQHFPDKEIKSALRSLVNWGVRGLIVGGIGGGKYERYYCQAAVKVRQGKVKDTNELLEELKEIIPTDGQFESAFKEATITKPRLARYLLLTLEAKHHPLDEPEFVPNANEEEVNLEHVLPRPPNSNDWAQFTKEEQRIWVNRLGNMVLLKKTPNGKIGKKPWEEKQPILAQSALFLTGKAAQQDSWTKQTIDEQQEEMASLAIDTWPHQPK